MTTTTEKPDVNQMRVIHRVFRRELGAVPDLVRRVPDGDIPRAAVVGKHATFLLTGLTIHHTGEDENLWPLLLARAAPSVDLVKTMQEQHERVHEDLDKAHGLLPGWQRAPDAESGERLAAAFEQLGSDLVEHLDQEERDILPLAEEHVSVAEWGKLGEHGRDSMAKSELPIMFGAILEDADPEESAKMLSLLPPPIRLFMRTVGARQYRRYICEVRGGA
ncbi:MAG TPA: hemerythrin domain-containing protein [Nocardioides sp.]|uniref:hemerythrin domain-containing protein n=1 Tax=Nocardioides sp. TaxID=35761 RepID=UPI002E3250D8|nr:hemerythrin domain-containing protein [Nocardioides sp.]HEX3931926.1 hemerythrin domain-containing protein [Nocardioides sp.]